MPQVSYALDDEACNLIAEMIQTIKSSEAGINALVIHAARRHGIKGMVRLGSDNRSIVPVSAAPQPPEAPEPLPEVLEAL